MTPDPAVLVARVQALGVTLRADGPDLVLDPAGVVPPDLKAELRAAKPALLTLLRDPGAQLRRAYHAHFLLAVRAVDGTLPDPRAIRGLRQEVARLTDEAGPLWADALFADELRRFRWETGRCGVCGGLAHPLEGP